MNIENASSTNYSISGCYIELQYAIYNKEMQVNLMNMIPF